MMRYYSSTATAKTLSIAVSNSATAMTLSDLTNLPSQYPYTLVLDPDTASEEIVTVASLSAGTTVNITRGQDGSSAVAHDAGISVKHMMTARDLQEPQDHAAATTSVHGVADMSALATDAELAAHAATTTSVHGITDAAALVTLTGTQTMTNKSMTAPVLTSPDIFGTPLIRLVDAKGDLLPGSSNNNIERLAVGSDGQVLTADAASSGGMKWAAQNVGGLTLLDTKTLTGASVTFSTIAQTYKSLRVIITGATASGDLHIRPNNVTDNCYAAGLIGAGPTSEVNFRILGPSGAAAVFEIHNYTAAAIHPAQLFGTCVTAAVDRGLFLTGVHRTASAITSIALVAGGGTFSAGTAYLYGVN